MSDGLDTCVIFSNRSHVMTGSRDQEEFWSKSAGVSQMRNDLHGSYTLRTDTSVSQRGLTEPYQMGQPGFFSLQYQI